MTEIPQCLSGKLALCQQSPLNKPIMRSQACLCRDDQDKATSMAAVPQLHPHSCFPPAAKELSISASGVILHAKMT